MPVQACNEIALLSTHVSIFRNVFAVSSMISHLPQTDTSWPPLRDFCLF